MTAATLNFLGKILCCPPIVNSPKGKPQATRTVIVAISPNNAAPNIENINQYSPFTKYKKFQLQILIHLSLQTGIYLCFLIIYIYTGLIKLFSKNALNVLAAPLCSTILPSRILSIFIPGISITLFVGVIPINSPL